MKRIYRSQTDKIIGGVCGGIGEYFSIDPFIVRIIFVILTITAGIGAPVYIVSWIIIPQSTQITIDSNQQLPKKNYRLIFGLIFIIIGSILIIDKLNLFNGFLFFDNFWYHFEQGSSYIKRFIWPITLIAIGVIIILMLRKSKTETESFHGEYKNNNDQTYTHFNSHESQRKFYRSREDRKIMGLCGGIAEYFCIDPSLVRILTIIVLFPISGPFAILIYFVVSWIIPLKPLNVYSHKSEKQEENQTFTDTTDDNSNIYEHPKDF